MKPTSLIHSLGVISAASLLIAPVVQANEAVQPSSSTTVTRLRNFTRPATSIKEQIEVIKGPASILYGEIQPGGVINLVSKKPLLKPFYAAELQLDSRGFVAPRFDISGPLTADGAVLYRLNGLYQRAESFVNFDSDDRRFSIAPTLS